MKAVIAKKIGMIQIYEDSGEAVIGTVLDLSSSILAKKDKDINGASHVELGYGKKKNPSKAELGIYKELGYVPSVKNDIKVTDDSSFLEMNAGASIVPELFTKGDKVTVSGVTKGKGFAGVVKRHKMRGGPKTHGQSDRERAIGSIGMRTIPGRVWKGKRMAGHMGNINKTIKNLKVALVDSENKIIVVSGSIPGSNGTLVIVKSK